MTAILTFLMGNWWRTAFLAASAGLLLQWAVLNRYQAKSAHLEAKLQTERADAQKALAAFEAAARGKERHLAEQAAEAERKYLDDLQAAKESADRVAADLRAGNLRLRREWLACTATAPMPGTPADPGQPDAGTDDRAGLAAAIVRAGAECAATVRGLQGLLRAEREAQ